MDGHAHNQLLLYYLEGKAEMGIWKCFVLKEYAIFRLIFQKLQLSPVAKLFWLHSCMFFTKMGSHLLGGPVQVGKGEVQHALTVRIHPFRVVTKSVQ